MGAFRQLVETNAQTGAKRVSQTDANEKATAKFQKYVGQQALFTDLDKGIQGGDAAQYRQRRA